MTDYGHDLLFGTFITPLAQPVMHAVDINADDELYMLWRCANINAVDRIGMSDHGSAGVFQLDALLKGKLHGSGLESHVEVIATIQGETEKKLVEVFRV